MNSFSRIEFFLSKGSFHDPGFCNRTGTRVRVTHFLVQTNTFLNKFNPYRRCGQILHYSSLSKKRNSCRQVFGVVVLCTLSSTAIPSVDAVRFIPYLNFSTQSSEFRSGPSVCRTMTDAHMIEYLVCIETTITKNQVAKNNGDC